MPPSPSSSSGDGPRSAERSAGRTAIVTGAAQGIGRAICERLLEAGAAGVVTFDRRPHDLGDPRCVALVADVGDPAAAQRSVDLCLERFGRLDLMAAHAGIADPRPLLETDDELWHRHMTINIDRVFYRVRAAARAMVAAGARGAIVCTASINAWHVEQTMAAYNVSKAAVYALGDREIDGRRSHLRRGRVHHRSDAGHRRRPDAGDHRRPGERHHRRGRILR